MFVKPWNEESFRILKQLSKYNGRAYTSRHTVSRNFGKKYPKLFKNGYLDVAKTRYSKRQDKTLFMTPPGITVIEKPSKRGTGFHFKRFELF